MPQRPNPFARQLRSVSTWGPGPVRTVLEVLHHFPSLVSPETPVAEARLVAVRAGVHHLPVVSESGEPLGVVCRCALMAAPNGVKVAECMHAPAITIDTGANLAEASALMLERGVGCLPAVYEGTVVGVLTRAELVEAGALSPGAAPRCSVCGTYDHVGPPDAGGAALCRRCRQGRQTSGTAQNEDDELAFGD